MLAVAVAAVVAGAIVVGVSSGGGSHGHAEHGTRAATSSEVALAAGYLDLSRAELLHELQSGRTLAQIASATSGRSVKGLVDALVAERAARIHAAVAANRTSPRSAARKLARLRRRITATIERMRGYSDVGVAAGYLGVSTTKLRNELLAGASLRQIAEATPGRSAAGLIDARVEAEQANLSAELASGRISRSAEQVLLSGLSERVTREVDRKPQR